jgi:hypothetical protein
VQRFNGAQIGESFSATQIANRGRGFAMTPVVQGRDVPAETATYHLVGMTLYAAPILGVLGPRYRVTGDMTFTPRANGRYVVRGTLSDTDGAIWIEDTANGAVVGSKIQRSGSARLGILE